MDRKDIYRLTRALVDHCIASYAEPPAAMVLDVDPSDAPTQGQQELAVSNQHAQHHGSLPLCLFAGPSPALVTAYLRPGPRPPGAANAMSVVRLLAYLRRHWPHTHILVRGDRHGATPEVSEVSAPRRWTDCGFGLAGQAVLLRQAAPAREAARRLHHQRVALAQAHGQAPPTSSRLYDECISAARSWAQPWRVVLKAEGMRADDPPRLVGTSLAGPPPQMLYEDLYGARGNGANAIKAVKMALHSDRTSAPTCLANALRLLLACAA
jgi:hypothetical protein